MPALSQLRIAAIVTDGFEEVELTETTQALRNAGAQVDILSIQSGHIQALRHAEKGITVSVDRVLNDTVTSGEYDALLLPGGALNADKLRIHPKVQNFVREFQMAEKPIAFICHAPWILISAGLVGGRKLTSYETIQDDVRNAGGDWVNEEVVVDNNWVSSRKPSDIKAFNREMISLFSRAVPPEERQARVA